MLRPRGPALSSGRGASAGGLRRRGVHGGSRDPVLRAVRAGPGFVRVRPERVPRLPRVWRRLLRRLLEPGRRRVPRVRPVPPGRRDHPPADRRGARDRSEIRARGPGCDARPVRRPPGRRSAAGRQGRAPGSRPSATHERAACRPRLTAAGSDCPADRSCRGTGAAPRLPSPWSAPSPRRPRGPRRDRRLGRRRHAGRRRPGRRAREGRARTRRRRAGEHRAKARRDRHSERNPGSGRCDAPGDARAAGHAPADPEGRAGQPRRDGPANDASADEAAREADRRGAAPAARPDPGCRPRRAAPDTRPRTRDDGPLSRLSLATARRDVGRLDVRAGAGAARTRRWPAARRAGACTTGTSACRRR